MGRMDPPWILHPELNQVPRETVFPVRIPAGLSSAIRRRPGGMFHAGFVTQVK